MKIIKNEKTAEIVGLSFGDGSLTRRKNGKLRFQIRGHIEEQVYYGKYIKPLFDKALGKTYATSYQGKKPYYGIVSEKQEICRGLEFLGIPVGLKTELTIPKWIKCNKEYVRAFLRGFIDTDGSVFCGKDYNYPKKRHIKIRMSIGNTSSKIIEEISRYLKEFGIHNLIIESYKQKNSNWRNLNKIQIDGPNVVKYFEIIGSMNPKHITKFKVWKKFGFCPPHTTLKQREMILKGNLDPQSFYGEDATLVNIAGVSEPGQKSTVEDYNQKPYALVAARVRIASPAFN